MSPVIFKSILPSLAYPIDNNKNFNNKPIFGKNKTWRGLILGILLAILTAFIQKQLYIFPFFQSLSFVNYAHWALLGFLLGAGALAGDLIESFFKRQLSFKEGKPWIPFDQLDFIIGALLLVQFVYPPSIKIIITLLIVSPILHILTNHIAFSLKIRKERW